MMFNSFSLCFFFLRARCGYSFFFNASPLVAPHRSQKNDHVLTLFLEFFRWMLWCSEFQYLAPKSLLAKSLSVLLFFVAPLPCFPAHLLFFENPNSISKRFTQRNHPTRESEENLRFVISSSFFRLRCDETYTREKKATDFAIMIEIRSLT